MTDIHVRSRANIIAEWRAQMEHHRQGVAQSEKLGNAPMARLFQREADRLQARIAELEAQQPAPEGV